MTLQQYLQEIRQLLVYKRGEDLAVLTTYQDNNHAKSMRIIREPREDLIRSSIFKPWDDMILAHLRVCRLLFEEDYIEAFKEQMNCMQTLTKILQAIKDDNWPLPVLTVVIRDLRLLAIAADHEAEIRSSAKGSSGGSKSMKRPHDNLEKSADLMMAIFRVCATDIRTAPEKSKRRGMITIVNQLFKIYYRINKLQLCKPLIRALENANMMDLFPTGQKVTYNYFLGMKSMYDSEYKKADELLTYSFRECYPHSYKNKRLILLYLVPVKMLLGQMPKEWILRKYDLMPFKPVMDSVKEGNIENFDRSLADGSEFFWSYGIYLILEKLRTILFRNIIKKVCLILNTPRVDMESFKVALEFLTREKMDLEEVHVIISNLIFENKIKGYISLQHQKLVVSKQNPFPKLSTVSL